MSEAEKKALLKLMKDTKEIKENVSYLVEATELLLKIQTEQINNPRGRR